MPKTQRDLVVEKYRLSPELLEQIKHTIIESLIYDKTPSENPLAIIVGGQSGSGKTALINYTQQLSSQRSFITIDNDYFRGFHPQANVIREQHPDYFRQATDQLGMDLTSEIVDYFIKNNYDVIFHQTLRNNRIADDAITKFRDSGYTVGVCAFAVPYFLSKASQVQRCISQIDKLGYCRYVQADSHISAYLNMPETIDYIQTNNLYDYIQVYKRSDNIAKPTNVYTTFNPQTLNKTLKTIKNCENLPQCEETYGFFSAKDAIIRTRVYETKKMESYLFSQIKELEKQAQTEELKIHIGELQNAFSIYQSNESVEDSLKLFVKGEMFSQNEELQNYALSVAESFKIPFNNLTQTNDVSLISAETSP
mgnify:CR=1 FL=1